MSPVQQAVGCAWCGLVFGDAEAHEAHVPTCSRELLRRTMRCVARWKVDHPVLGRAFAAEGVVVFQTGPTRPGEPLDEAPVRFSAEESQRIAGASGALVPTAAHRSIVGIRREAGRSEQTWSFDLRFPGLRRVRAEVLVLDPPGQDRPCYTLRVKSSKGGAYQKHEMDEWPATPDEYAHTPVSLGLGGGGGLP